MNTHSRPSDQEPDETSLLAAFTSSPIQCPAPELVFASREGALPSEVGARVTAHVERCHVCQALQETLDAVPADGLTGIERQRIWNRVSAGTTGQAWSSRVRQWAPLAVAATLVIALSALVLQIRQSPDAPMRRGEQSTGFRNELRPEAVLPRAACELRWSSNFENARYDVFVTDEDLNPLASAAALESQRFVVPSPALQAVPAAGRILWRVEALLPDGRRFTSPTFTSRVE